MNILVTGSNGQLGSEIKQIKHLFEGHALHFTDVAELDITNDQAVSSYFYENKTDCCINCAAYTAVDKAESDIELCTKINTNAPSILAKACKQNGALLIHISTDFVFDGSNSIPYVESNPTCPISIYGETKLNGERAIESESGHYIIIRTSWLYSEFGNNFVKTMQRLGGEKHSLNVIFDQIGTPTYAADLAVIIHEIINQFKPEYSGIYNYSNEGVASWFDFAHAVMHESKLHCKVYPIETVEYPTPAKRPHYSVLNKNKIKKTFGISIKHWRESLAVCIQKLK